MSIVVAITTLQIVMFLAGGENTVLVQVLTMVSIVLLLTGASLFVLSIFTPVNRLSGELLKLHRGAVPSLKRRKANNEFGDIEKVLKEHFEYLDEVIRFTHGISKGDSSNQLKIRSEDDRIGKALHELRDQLNRTRREEEMRRTKDEQQNWAAKGLARIGELLRAAEDDIYIMSNEFIRELVEYVNMEVGGFFLVRDDKGEEPELELTGSFAFDREKQIEKKFKFGEGLVGRCAVEKDSIIITEVPEDYIRIRSGLGEDLPSTLILVPVLLDEEVLGVIELATFSEVPEYKIHFIESLSTSIAASVTKVKVNISTAKLLQQSRQQSEELSKREEEMRQGIEELKSIQEQSAKREAELLKEVDELKAKLSNRPNR